jgi:hypothetical protein
VNRRKQFVLGEPYRLQKIGLLRSACIGDNGDNLLLGDDETFVPVATVLTEDGVCT